MAGESTTKVPESVGLLPVDRLLFGALAVLTIVAAVAHPRPLPFIFFYAALAAFLGAAVRFAPRLRMGNAVHAFAPIVVLLGIYETVGFLVEVANSARWDATFAAFDARWFGALVPAWRGAFGRPAWLCDFFSIAYVSYYFIPVVMGIALYARRRGEYDRFALTVIVSFLASYVGYFLFPTSGPRVPLASAQSVLGGGALSAYVRRNLHTFEFNTLDAFPSGHTAVSIVLLAEGWRLFPRWRATLAVVVVSIVFSTVYLSHHYIIDVVAGGLLALVLVAAMPQIERLLGTKSCWLGAKEISPS